MPRVSVIVAARDAEAHVGEALASVAAQTYPDWEVVVADDASSDRTAEVAAETLPAARVVRSASWLGQSGARNLALENASGELVAILDSDDTWLPEYLERQVARYDAERGGGDGAAIVCCDALLREGERILDETYGERFGRPGTPVTAADLLAGNRIFISALCDREAVDAAGGFDPGLRAVEDLDLWLRIVETGGRVAYQPEALAVYRISDDSLSRDPLLMARSLARVHAGALARGRLDRPTARRARWTTRRHRLAARLLAARAAAPGAARARRSRA